jgi:hypothetical protein
MADHVVSGPEIFILGREIARDWSGIAVERWCLRANVCRTLHSDSGWIRWGAVGPACAGRLPSAPLQRYSLQSQKQWASRQQRGAWKAASQNANICERRSPRFIGNLSAASSPPTWKHALGAKPGSEACGRARTVFGIRSRRPSLMACMEPAPRFAIEDRTRRAVGARDGCRPTELH